MRQTPQSDVRFAARARFRALILGIAVILPGVVGGCDKNTRDTDIKFARLSEVRALVDRRDRGEKEVVLLIDPRPEKAFAAGHLPGARNLRLPQVDPKKDTDPEIEKFDRLVVYGDDPASAAARGMAKRLLAVGYKGVRLYSGGVKEWLSRGYETETALATSTSPPGVSSASATKAAPPPPARPQPARDAASTTPKDQPGDGG